MLSAAAIALGVVAVLTGCSSSEGGPRASKVDVPASGGVPHFSGPWAEEFDAAYRSTDSAFVHGILAKGSITDQDYAEVSSRYIRCMKNKGFTATVDGPAGEGTVDGKGDGDPNAAHEACSEEMAVIASLRGSILRNPEHKDENTIVAACLVAKKLAPASYTAKDYAADLETMRFPFDRNSAGFTQCISDPLGLGLGSRQ
jgi:hypothetical protein